MEYLKLPQIPSVSWGESGLSVSLGEEEEPEEKDCVQEAEEYIGSLFPVCSFQTRVTGCLLCLGLGFLIQMGSTVRLFALLRGNPKPFAVMYTSGNAVSIAATLFFYGPWSQCKKMFESVRIAATLIYLFWMSVTLFLTYYPEPVPARVVLIVMSIFFQFCALVWYTLSYIPYGRSIALSCCKGLCPAPVASAVACDCCADEEQARSSSSSFSSFLG